MKHQSVALGNPESEKLRDLASLGRWHVVNSVSKSKAGHVGGPLSAMDMLVYLYFKHLNLDPESPLLPERDRFILSKGHSAIGLYSVMALRGYFPISELATFDKGDSRLQGHPDSTKLPGIEISTGSLGQGLGFGVGVALAARQRKAEFNTWVMMGDGELQEGMVWESVIAAANLKLSNLTAIVDLNGLGQYGLPRADSSKAPDRSSPWDGFDLGNVFRSFNWTVVELDDGHDIGKIAAAFTKAEMLRDQGQPVVIIARTVKGKGLSFAEGKHKWHTGIATEEQLKQALLELELNEEIIGEEK
jgi:transketolase